MFADRVGSRCNQAGTLPQFFSTLGHVCFVKLSPYIHHLTKIALFQYALTAVCGLFLHLATRFCLFTAHFRIVFFFIAHLPICTHHASSGSFFLNCLFRESSTFLLLNKFVISSKDFMQCCLAVLKNILRSIT